MAQTIVDLTLGTIRLLVEEVKFLSRVRDEIEDVQKELEKMQAFMEDIDARKYKDKTVECFFKEIKELCFRIEDVVDTYAAEVAHKRQKKGVVNFLNRLPECICIHKVGTEVASIKAHISKLTTSMNDFGIRKILGSQKSDETDGRKRETSSEGDGGKGWLRRTYGFEVDNDFVGKEKDIQLLVSELSDGDASKHRVVSIYGMGGLGKTTLAQKIYHHDDIRKGYEAFAWVCVSKNCEPRNIFQNLLQQLSLRSIQETNDMGDNILVQEVAKELQKKKCLVVLDDIWEAKDWGYLSPAFKVAGTNSKVLITTRKRNVAEIGFFHPLDVLSEDEAWDLFQKKAFATTVPQDFRIEPKTMEELGKNMVQKCGRLPLAIRVIGGILGKRKSLDAWVEVNSKIDTYLRSADGNEDDWEIKQVLSLSYDDLPNHLKPCFLYLSRCQEDENIRVEELYLLWIAEGIVFPKDQGKHETLMDIAKCYLNELANRSMVQVQADEITAPEEFQYCRLHDLLRDLCLEKAGKEGFLNHRDSRGGKRSSLSISRPNSCLRRLAVYVQSLEGFSLNGESTRRLRSLLLHVPKPYYLFQDLDVTLPREVIDFKNLKFLRVLNFQYVKFEDTKLLAEICQLIHLRLLAFWYCHLLELPSCIGDLPFLQTLDLECRSFLKIPDVLQKLKRLKYLKVINAGAIKGKLSLAGLDELEILYGFKSNTCKIKDLSELKTLRRLKADVYGNGDLSEFIDSIEAIGMHLDMSIVVICNCELSSPEGMILLKKLFMCRNIHHIDITGMVNVGKLPEYESGFFPSLTELNLQGGEIWEDPMSTLENLPKLRKLILTDRSFVGKEMICHANGFAQLRYLEFNRLSSLEKWRVDRGAMPCLSFLKLSSCYRLDMIPEGIRFIGNLETLDIAYMSKTFQRSAVEGENFDKFGHVKSIFFHLDD